MKNNQSITDIVQKDYPFMEDWISQAISVANGLYHLAYDGEWHCLFASEGCFEMINCPSEDFLESLQNITVLTSFGAPEKTVGELLQEIIDTQGQRSFVSAVAQDNGKHRYIRGTLAVSRGSDGLPWAYGQIADLSAMQENPYDGDVLAIAVTHNVDKRKEAEEMAANEKIFSVVAQHSDRTLCYYDIKSKRPIPWNKEDCDTCSIPHMCLKKFSLEQFNNSEYILPDSIDAARRMFEEIHDAAPFGEAHIHIRMPDDAQRWMEFKYSGLMEGDMPIAAILSFKDITEQHEQELAYQRYTQSLKYDADGHLMYIESDLTADRIEKLAGQLLHAEERNIKCTHSDFGRLMLRFKFEFVNPEEASQYFSCKNLLGLYAKGVRNHRSEWQVRFPDDSPHWLETDIVLMADPYNSHVMAFFRMFDITEEREERLSVLHRADFDAMTGLLRKGAGEERIKRYLGMKRDKGGVLIALDLDDLKSINDNLGHKQGDAAIIGISDMLKSHFHKEDILVRFGGDEFLVFMPDAGESVSSVELIMTSLLRKLSGIAIGENKERRIHCSAGCAVEELGTDNFDSLYRRADMALYYVKRHGKNHFVFFEQEMVQEDYEFRVKQTASKIAAETMKDDLHYMLETVAAYFSETVSFNLTNNYYHILVSNRKPITEPGTIEQFWQSSMENIHPDDREGILSILSRDRLLTAYEKGERGMRHHIRYLEQESFKKTEIIVHLYTTGIGDICAFLFFRWDTAPEKDLEILRLQKIMEVSVKKKFEYICLIDVRSRSYSTFSRDRKNTHDIPEIADFDVVTKHIRDTKILPEGRDAYYEAAALEKVLAHLEESGGSYSYHYTLIDGIRREATFNWYEDSHSELLMTVCKVVE